METVSVIEIGYERPECECGTLMEIKRVTITEVDNSFDKGVITLKLICDNVRCPLGFEQDKELRVYNPAKMDVYNPDTHRPHKIPSNQR